MSIQHYKVGKVGKPAYKTAALTDANCRISAEKQGQAMALYMHEHGMKQVTLQVVSEHEISDNYKFRHALFSTLLLAKTGTAYDQYGVPYMEEQLNNFGYKFNRVVYYPVVTTDIDHSYN